MKKTLLTCFSIMLTLSIYAQDRSVSGKVSSSEDGSALPGVNVLLKGTTVGTVTDATGSYAITVPTGDGILIFSFIGLLTQEVDIAERTSIDVTMSSDITQLTEVIVTAQGILKT